MANFLYISWFRLLNTVFSNTFNLDFECSFEFTASPPAEVSALGWGSSVIGGTYTETISGIRKAKQSDGTTTNTVTVSGTFVLRRVSEIGSITTN